MLLFIAQAAHSEVSIETVQSANEQTRIYPNSKLFLDNTSVERWNSLAKYAPLILSTTEEKMVEVFGGSASPSESPETNVNTRHYIYVLDERYDQWGTPVATVLDICVTVRGGKVSYYNVQVLIYLTFE